jgi:hypothetical protein
MKLRTSYRDLAEAVRNTSGTVNQIVDGRSLAYGSVTLTASTTTTVVTDDRVSENSVICLMPQTANAAGAIATTYIATVANGTFTITHANNAQTDRDFAYSIQG